MLPSPSLRCSPMREHRMENIRKRGQSFESGLTLGAKVDDLALFNDMQNKERESFLLHTSDDFDDSLSKLRYLSDFNLGITIPARGERSDLLYADGEKNDYDWLLTPPDTPLFPSLDDDEPQPYKLPHRGRPRSQPINVSRSLPMNEKTDRNSRSSASPHRLSPTPHPSNNIGQMVSRPSSAIRSSPPLVSRPALPSTSQRPSTPLNRQSTPTQRSSTPTPRRMSTGSTGQTPSFVRRGTSPIRASRGNSASPKFGGWQSNLSGFPSDAPPNLRTSPSDRPSPHTRGLSASPRSGRGRHSMSPASRSASSSHSNERDVFSSYSKGSVVSSGDDEVDSLHSMAISSSPPARRNGMSVNSRPLTVSKKPSRTSPANSMPKRSFGSVIRQMDQRKTPQNMFRPLLSSVPATTFYVGKANSTQRPMFSRNSSLTTSTSASSDQGASVAPDMESSEHDQNDLAGEWDRGHDPESQEVFIFDKIDGIIEDGAQELQAGNPHGVSSSFDAGMSNKVDAHALEGSIIGFGGVAGTTASEFACASGDASVVDGCESVAICSKCGKRFRLLEVDRKIDVCQECVKIDGLFTAAERLLPPTANHNQTVKSEIVIETDALVNEVQLSIEVPKLPASSIDVVAIGQHTNKFEEGVDCLDNGGSPQSVIDKSELHLSDQYFDGQQYVNSTQCGSANKFVDAETFHPSFRIDNPEARGISILLPNPLSSNKWPVVQSRAFSATNILCAESSYLRDNTSTMKRSIGQDGSSIFSSVDLRSSSQADVPIQCQFSSRKIDMDSVRSDTHAKSQCGGSHPELMLNSYKPLVPPKNDTTEFFINFTKVVDNEALQEPVLVGGELDSSIEHTGLNCTNVSSCMAVDSDAHFSADCCGANHSQNDTSKLQLFSYIEGCQSEALSNDNRKDEDLPSCINASEDPGGENNSSLDIVPNSFSDSLIVGEQSVLNGPACRSDASDAATHNFSGVIFESQNDHDRSQELHMECAPEQVSSNVEAFPKHSISTTSKKGDLVSGSVSGLVDHAHHIHEESNVMVEGPRGHTSRSLTLAEATDTILFCSSIIHDIAYKAATIGMDKELALLLETSRPTVTILGKKSFNDQNEAARNPNKNSLKSRKFTRKKLETQGKSPLTESEINVVIQESAPLVNADGTPKKAPDTIKPPNLESKCNCTVM